jgi:(p)ppGpp synthase/HD superfamily hydrolase
MEKYYQALSFAAKLHDGQYRKMTRIPYLTHLMTVSSYVFEFGGNEDQAIGGLLHDAIEDCGTKTSYDEIGSLFGPEVVRIVKACTDAEVLPKPPWEERKKAYLEALSEKDDFVKLVVACDKLHNAQCIVRDVKLLGSEVWSRFNAKPDRILWYYQEVVRALEGFDSPVVRVLRDTVREMEGL